MPNLFRPARPGRRSSYCPHLEHLEDRVLFNVAPIAVNDAYLTKEDTALVVGASTGVLANDIDPDSRLLRAKFTYRRRNSDPLSAALVSGPSHGVLTLDANGAFSYTPNANFHGSDSFTYQALDAAGAAGLATVSITVNQVSDFSAVTARLEESVTSGKLTGVGLIILDGDEVLYQEAFGNQTLDTQLFIASASKLTSATVMMTLVDDGLIALDDPISKYLPQFTGSVGAITIRQLLSQTHGLPGNHRTLNAPGEDNGLTLEQCVNAIAADFASGRLRPVRPAGTEFEYSPGISYQIFGRIAEIVTGQTWDVLWHERVGDPLQMTHSTYGATNNPRLAGGMASTLADYGRLVQIFLNGGATPDGVRILSAAAVAEMLKNQVAGLPFHGSQAMHTEGYGLSWWHNDMNTVLSVPGAYGAIPWVDFSHGYAAFLLTYDLQADSVPVWEDIVPLIGAELGSAELGGTPLTAAVGASAGLDSLTVSALTGATAKMSAPSKTSSTRQTSGYMADSSVLESSLGSSHPEPAGYFAGLRDSKPVATKGDSADPFADWIWRLDR